MKKVEKTLFWVMLIVMLAAMLPASAFAAEETGVRFEMVDVGGEVYKLVFQAKTPTTIHGMSVVFSYDKGLIQPVAAWDTSYDVDVSYMKNPDNHDSSSPFESRLLALGAGTPDSRRFSFAPTRWEETADRAGFMVALFHVAARRADSSGEYVELFDFYFRFKDGKSPEDIEADTFKFETADDPDHILNLFFNRIEICYGIVLDEVAGQFQYVWGYDLDSHDEYVSLDEVINPFAGLKPDPDPDETDKDDPIDEEPPEDGDPDDEQPPVDGEIPDPEEPGTPPADEAELIEAIPSAYVEKLSGNKNRLFITVTELYSDGTENTAKWDGLIDNNAAGTYQAGEYQVYVETKGNDQIRACYIVE